MILRRFMADGRVQSQDIGDEWRFFGKHSVSDNEFRRVLRLTVSLVAASDRDVFERLFDETFAVITYHEGSKSIALFKDSQWRILNPNGVVLETFD